MIGICFQLIQIEFPSATDNKITNCSGHGVGKAQLIFESGCIKRTIRVKKKGSDQEGGNPIVTFALDL